MSQNCILCSLYYKCFTSLAGKIVYMYIKSLSYYYYLCNLRRLMKLQMQAILTITIKNLKFSQYLIFILEYIKIMQILALYRQNSDSFLLFPLCLSLRTCMIHIIFNKTH